MLLRRHARFYPTTLQKEKLEQTFGACRKIYNLGLNMRSANYKNGIKCGYRQTALALTKYKRLAGNEWLSDVSSVPLQQSLRHLDTAFTNFFNKRTAYPQHKLKRGRQSATFTSNAFTYNPTNRSLRIAKLGKVKIRYSRTFTSTPTTVTITKDCAGRYFVTFVLDEPVKPFPKTGKTVGVDMGLSALATFSTGEKIDNLQLRRNAHKKIARAQRVLARRTKGSNRWERQRLRLARLEAHVADARKDFYDKVTTDIVRRFDFISVETLGVKNMMRNRSVARSFGDAAVGMFLNMLQYKAAWYGKTFVKVGRFFPSTKKCSDCGYINKSLTLGDREWSCPECGVFHDRDLNAACNILAEGHSVFARGEDIRPVIDGRSRRSVN